MKDAISALREERAALRARLEKIETAISDYNRWAESVQGLLGETKSTKADTTRGSAHAPIDDAPDQLRSSSIAEFEEAVRLILGEAEKPYQRGDLLSALQRLGIVIVSSNPANAMATRLSRMDDVVNIKGEGYWLVDKLADAQISGEEAGNSLL